MTDFDRVEQLKRGLIAELNTLYGSLALTDLATLVEAQEALLRDRVGACIALHGLELFGGTASSHADSQIVIAGERIDVIVRGGLPALDTVEVWILRRGPMTTLSKPITHRLKWKAVGQYQKAALFVSPDIGVDVDLLCDIIQAVFETGYRWYEEKLHSLVTDDSVTARRLYSLLRTIIHDDDSLHRLWLVSSDNEGGCYLVDDRVASAAMTRLRPHARDIGKSAIRILSEMVSTTIPFEITHSRAAIAEDRCVDVSLSDSKYANDRALLAASEVAFYGTPHISIFPIVRTGKSYLVAVFPTEDRNYFEPLLAAHITELRTEFEAFRHSLSRLLKALKQSRGGLLNAQVGEFVGGALAGAYKSLGGGPG